MVPLKTLEPNAKGRDFVVGDLHGMISALVNLLHNVGFDPEVDRLVSAGDLVDRGEDSLACLRLLRESWFFAVLANHEQMMLDAFNGGYSGQFWPMNGGLWGMQALVDWQNQRKLIINKIDQPPPPEPDSLELFELLKLAEQLPLVITIKRPDGKKFHVIHAEFPPANEVTDEILEDPQKIIKLNSVQTRDGDHLVWGRHIFYQFYKKDLSNKSKIDRTVMYSGLDRMFNDNLSHIISGHTIVQKPLTIVGQTNIDTGAYGQHFEDPSDWECLTMVELGSWKFYQATADMFRECEPIVVNKETILEIRNGKATEGSGS